MTRRLVPSALLVVLALALPGRAAAHAFDPAVLEIRIDEGAQVDLSLRVPPSLSARLGSTPRPRVPAGCRVVEQTSAVALRLDCAAAAQAGDLPFGVDGIGGTPALAGEAVEVLVHALLPDGNDRAAALHGEDDALRLPLANRAPSPPGARAVLVGYLGLGARHIVGGFDHLLFLAGLLLLLRGAATLLRTVTAFTVAHGLTVVASTLGGLSLPPPPVEALIAASIVLLARELVAPPRSPAEASLLRRAPALSAFAFGLLHGLGFAAALAEAGLPAAHVPLALLGFNLGVEGGQLAVVALLLPLVIILRRAPLAPRLPGYALGAVASAWLIVRLGAVVGLGGVA